jgi:HlyD family secretion protein
MNLETESLKGTAMNEIHGRTLFSLLLILTGVSLLFQCDGTNHKDFIGSAVVEAKTYHIATTSQGLIHAILKEEGMAVKAGDLVAIIDTIPLTLKINEILAMQAQSAQTIAGKRVELASQENDQKAAQREYRRIAELVEKGSLPSQQKDNLETQSDAVNLRLKASGFALASLLAQEKTLQAQMAQVRDQIQRCYVTAPVAGVVLTRYKNVGEVYLPGNPIYEIGNYDTMRIDFYVAQPMLPELKLGQSVRIRLDASLPENVRFIPAVISWIGSDAKISPKNIQTRKSRNELVFRVRSLAPNRNGLLKRGLPVEVWK